MSRRWLRLSAARSMLAWLVLVPAAATAAGDNLLFLMRDRNPYLTLFDAAREKAVGDIALPGPPKDVLLLKQAKRLLVTLDREIMLLELDTREVVARMPFASSVKPAVASPDEAFVAVADVQGAVHVASSKNLSALSRSPLRFDAVADVFFDSTGALVVLTGISTPVLVRVDLATGATVRSAMFPARRNGLGDFVVFAGGRRFAALDEEGRSLLVTDADGEFLLSHNLDRPSDLLLPAPNHVLVLASDRQSVTVVPAAASKAPRAIDLPFVATSHAPVFGALMTAFASREQRRLALVDSQTLSLVGPVVDLPGRPEGMASVAVAPLNLYVLLGDSGAIAVVNLYEPAVTRTVEGLTMPLLGIASPAPAGICH